MDAFLVRQNRYSVVWDESETDGNVSLLRSEHPHDRYREIADVTGLTQYVDVPQGEDGEELSGTRFREWYYKIVSESGEIGPAYVSGEVDRHALQASRLAWRHLKRDIATKGYLLPRPTKGERCPDCWDEDRQQVTRAQCSSCGGTGFRKGYSTPVEIFLSFDDKKVHPEDYPNMKFAQGQHKMWTANEPIVRDGDYIIRARDLEVYEVLRVQPTTKSGLVVRQPMMGRVVDKSSVRTEVVDQTEEFITRYTESWGFSGRSKAPFRGA